MTTMDVIVAYTPCAVAKWLGRAIHKQEAPVSIVSYGAASTLK